MLLCVIVCIIYITLLVNYIFFFIPCKFFDKAHIYKQIRRCECQPFSKKYFIQTVQFEDLVLKSVIDYSESENMNCVFLEKVRYIFF